MKISELIKNLEAIKDKSGDIEVMFEEQGFGGHALHTIDGAKKSSIHSAMIEDLDEREFRKLFPDWDGETEYWETNMQVDCVELSMGTMLYST